MQILPKTKDFVTLGRTFPSGGDGGHEDINFLELPSSIKVKIEVSFQEMIPRSQIQMSKATANICMSLIKLHLKQLLHKRKSWSIKNSKRKVKQQENMILLQPTLCGTSIDKMFSLSLEVPLLLPLVLTQDPPFLATNFSKARPLVLNIYQKSCLIRLTNVRFQRFLRPY